MTAGEAAIIRKFSAWGYHTSRSTLHRLGVEPGPTEAERILTTLATSPSPADLDRECGRLLMG